MVERRERVGNLPNATRYSKADCMRLIQRIADQEKITVAHDERITKVETYCAENREMMGDIADIKLAIFKIFKYLKIAAPSIISAAIAAGIVNGEVGAFLNGLFTGS